MATQPTSDAPFGLQPNVAAGLAYLLGIVGGIIMFVGGGTNRFVKWSAAQSITMWATYIVFYIAVTIVDMILGIAHLWPLIGIIGLISMIVGIAYLVLWVWSFVTGFQGKELRLPIFADLTNRFFAAQLA